jgi:hypothetical protein
LGFSDARRVTRERNIYMSHRTLSHRSIISLTAAAILAVACVSTDAFAYRGGGRGVGRVGGVGHVGGYGRGYGRGSWGGVGVGVGVGLGAAAVGAAVAAPYYNSARCGYYPYPACY